MTDEHKTILIKIAETIRLGISLGIGIFVGTYLSKYAYPYIDPIVVFLISHLQNLNLI